MARKKSGLALMALAAAFVGRQGDVAILRVNALPAGLSERKRDKGRVVLAYGEVTGHAHAITENRVIQYEAANPTEAANKLLADVGLTVELSEHNAPSFLAVEEPATVEHEEHNPIALEPGRYVVIRQREWSDAEEPIQVLD